MNDRTSELQRRLEQATAGRRRPGCPLDAETASLREGWLALGSLLEAAYPADDLPLAPAPARRRETFMRRRLKRAAALAASLVLGATVVLTLIGRSWLGTTAMPERREAALARSAGSPARASSSLAWEDPLDDQIALAGQAVIQLQEDWRYLEDTFGAVRYGLQEAEQEIDDSTL